MRNDDLAREQRRLLLTYGAVIGRTLSLREVFNWSATNAAWLAAALVDIELLPKISRVAVGVHVVAQRGATHLDGHLQDRSNGARQTSRFFVFQAACLPLRPDARAKQRFA